LQLSKVYALHAGLEEKVLALILQFSNEINSDFGGLFAEKKYKELMCFAEE
jgi:hypothetical protein